MDSRLFGIFLVFAPLSLFSFGGGQAIIAEMQHQVVDVQHWMTGREFVDLFALSRAAPGPSTLIAALIGWHVAGFLGAVAGTIGIYLPSSIVMYGAVRWWHARADSPWRAALQRGLAPIALGLVLAGVATVLQAAQANVLQLAAAIVAAGLLVYTKTSPYPLMLIAAIGFGALYYF
jgi:chromate transporter